MIIYHGAANKNDLAKANKVAPRFTHGEQWAIHTMTDYPGVRYILDNGAFNAFRKNEVWDVDGFLKRLLELDTKMTEDPDFVVLPDVMTDSKATYKRSKLWSEFIDWPTAFAVQDGMKPYKAIEYAQELGARALFIGGTMKYKRNVGPEIVEQAHENDLWAHVARPGDILWAEDIGADSVDLTSIVRNQSWERLKKVQEQTTLA